MLFKTESIRSFYQDNVANANVLNLAEEPQGELAPVAAAQVAGENVVSPSPEPEKVDLSLNPLLATAEPMRVPPKMDVKDVGLVTGDIKHLQDDANRKGETNYFAKSLSTPYEIQPSAVTRGASPISL